MARFDAVAGTPASTPIGPEYRRRAIAGHRPLETPPDRGPTLTTELKVPYGLDAVGSEVRPDAAIRSMAYMCPSPICERRELVLKRGPIVQAHFAHKVLPARCDFWEETEAHLRAKQLVAALIETGAQVTLVRHCATCGGEVRQALPSGTASASLEHVLPTGLRADVALLGANGQVRAIVEILSTHEVDAAKAAVLADLPWVELRAEELLATPREWRMLQDHLRPVHCARCRYAAVRPFIGSDRLSVECPLPDVGGSVIAVATCPRCPYLIGVKDGGVFCYGNDRAAD